jgi:pimeloyl-ACP methyl ester carboxylesterase
MTDEHRAPPRYLLFLDLGSFASRLWRAFGHLGERGPEDGPPLMVVPGFFATDRTTLGLQRGLARAGFRVRGWGLGFNRGAYETVLEDIIEQLEGFGGGRPVILVGWSLGGLFAREVAKRRPDLVRCVFTMGSPFSGDPRANNAWKLYEKVAGHPVDQPPIEVDVSAKPPVPTYALWSPRDGMVAPASARGTEEQSDERIEVCCGHMGFAANGRAIREVVKLVRERTLPGA